jgi:hypothetical protein
MNRPRPDSSGLFLVGVGILVLALEQISPEASISFYIFGGACLLVGLAALVFGE